MVKVNITDIENCESIERDAEAGLLITINTRDEGGRYSKWDEFGDIEKHAEFLDEMLMKYSHMVEDDLL